MVAHDHIIRIGCVVDQQGYAHTNSAAMLGLEPLKTDREALELTG